MLFLVRIWIILSTILVAAGWALSLVHQLNALGYSLVILLAAGWLWVVLRNKYRGSGRGFLWLLRKFKKRFSRPAPLLFVVLVVLSLLSGSLYPLLNYDANWYRLPRVFHWLAENHWYLIHTQDGRMNVSACGQEWLMAPLLAITHTDRLIFLINWDSFLMLPGLVFSVFVRWRVKPRVAWWWMWFLSSGWCFVLQASSGANDSFAAVYALASVDLAMRAAEKGNRRDLWLSCLAAALVTGAKQTNLPLVLLWFLAAWPARALLLRQKFKSTIVAGLAGLVSCLPITISNCYNYGSWMPIGKVGLSVFGDVHLNPFWGVVGNLFCLPLQNLFPPFYEFLPPFYDYGVPAWNAFMVQFRLTPFGHHFASFEKFGFLSVPYYHGLSEGNAGIGLGVCALLFGVFYIGRRFRKSSPKATRGWRSRCTPLLLAPWILLLIFMAKVGLFENARHLSPYYIFLFPLLLGGLSGGLAARNREWQKAGLLIMLVTGLMVVTLPARPLFPAQTLMNALGKRYPHSELVASECSGYIANECRCIGTRRVWLANELPTNETVIGFYSSVFDHDEPGIWLPWGRHTVRLICPADSPGQLHQENVHYMIIEQSILEHESITLASVLARFNGSVVKTCPGLDYQNYQVFPFNQPRPSLYLIRLY